jgi:site-specific DNA-methyltransferase (adenine-specific)
VEELIFSDSLVVGVRALARLDTLPPIKPRQGADSFKKLMKPRAANNRTLSCDAEERTQFSSQLLQLAAPVQAEALRNRIVHGDSFNALRHFPAEFADVLILDPPYNLSKNYHGHLFKEKDNTDYQAWFDTIIQAIKPVLKKTASVYVCADWKTSILIAPILAQHFYLRNRITWEREKGRGAKHNWKNASEDIWFCTCSKQYFFDVEAVKLKRKVIAPYKVDGKPKDWTASADGNYRLTHPSNLWTDISIPFWSMPENTDHPTQKPEKLIAKLLLASSRPGDVVFDPFLGSGTTAVVAKKLDRTFCAIEMNPEYCCWAMKRLQRAASDKSIQGYADGVFWERNTEEGRRGSKNQSALFPEQ